MKKYLKTLSFFALSLSVAFSCAKEPVTDLVSTKKTPENLVKVEFTAGILTKTSIDESLKNVSWTEGDKVLFAWDVNGDSNSAESDAISSISSETGAAKIIANLPAAFSDDSFSGSRTLYGVYPSSLTAAVESSKLTLTVPSEQDGSFEKANISASEWSEGSSALAFKNICGLLQVKIEDSSVRKVVLDAGEALVAGKAEVTFTKGVPSISVTEGVSTVTLNVSGEGTYYIAVLPATLAGFSVTLYDADGTSIGRQTTENSLSVTRTSIRKLGTVEIGFDDKFFATPGGRGSKSGRSWDNAADIAALRAFVSTDTEAEIYLSGGTYSLTSPFESNAASTAKFTVRGGYPSNSVDCSTEGRDVSANATVFDGGSASRLWLLSQGTFSFDGVTFQNANSASKVAGGAFGITSTVTFTSCTFSKNSTDTDYGTGNVRYAGGAMNLGENADVTIEGCKFEANYAGNGGSINSNAATSVLNVKNTTFSKDFTYNTSGSVQCCNGTQVFENCTFDNCYTREGTGGALHMGGTSNVTVKGCTFKGCEAGREKYPYLTTDDGALGGAISTETSACLTVENCTFDGNVAASASAILVKNGNEVIKVNNSVFKNNKCASRGIIRVIGSSVTFLNNCRFFDNTKRTKWWGSVIHGASPAAVCMNNCSCYNNLTSTEATDNKFYSVCLNHDGWFIGTNCTIIANNDLATYRNNSSTKANKGYWFNSILANAHNKGLALNSAAMTSVINTTNCILGPKVTYTEGYWTDSNSTVDENILTGYDASFDSSKQVWLWNGPADSFTKTTESAVKAALEAMTDNNGNTTLNAAFGPEFAKWVESLGGFTKDCLGNTRTASGTWPGAIETK